MTYSREFSAAVHFVRKMPALLLMFAILTWLAGCFGERVAVDERETDEASVPGTYFLVKQRLPILDRTGMVLASSPASGTSLRNHPWKGLALPVLGMVDGFGHGLSGIEYSFDTRLTPGIRRLEELDSEGIYLSLDVRIQQKAEKLLSWQMNRLKAEAGSMVIMDIETGEVLAMANRLATETDPKADVHHIPNLAIQRIIDPWPVPILASIKLEGLKKMKEAKGAEGDVADTSALSDPGNTDFIRADKWHWSAIEDSPGAIWTRLADEQFELLQPPQEGLLPLMVRLGFGQRTGIELPDESLGLLPTEISPQMAREAGSGIQATPLQTLTAFCRLIAGNRLKPTILRTEVGKEGASKISSGQGPSDQSKVSPAKEDIADDSALDEEIQRGLLALLADDSGPAVAAVRTDEAGGTGRGGEVLSLAFWPGEEPKVAMITVLWGQRCDPRIKKGTLGRASSLLRYAGTIVQETRAWAEKGQKPAPSTLSKPAQPSDPYRTAEGARIMPDLRGRSLRLAFEEIQALGLTAEIEGAGIVASQHPAPGTKIKPGAICQIIGRRQNS